MANFLLKQMPRSIRCRVSFPLRTTILSHVTGTTCPRCAFSCANSVTFCKSCSASCNPPLYSLDSCSVSSAYLHVLLTFHMRHSRGEIFVDLCHLSVCLSVATFLQYCTDPDVTLANGRACPVVVPYCGFVIGARVLLLWQRTPTYTMQ